VIGREQLTEGDLVYVPVSLYSLSILSLAPSLSFCQVIAASVRSLTHKLIFSHTHFSASSLTHVSFTHAPITDDSEQTLTCRSEMSSAELKFILIKHIADV